MLILTKPRLNSPAAQLASMQASSTLKMGGARLLSWRLQISTSCNPSVYRQSSVRLLYRGTWKLSAGVRVIAHRAYSEVYPDLDRPRSAIRVGQVPSIRTRVDLRVLVLLHWIYSLLLFRAQIHPLLHVELTDRAPS